MSILPDDIRFVLFDVGLRLIQFAHFLTSVRAAVDQLGSALVSIGKDRNTQ